jgi:hypothetical protein
MERGRGVAPPLIIVFDFKDFDVKNFDIGTRNRFTE